MTAITSPTELSVEDLPMNLKSGTGKRRVKFHIRLTSEGAADYIDLTDFIPTLAAIEHINESVFIFQYSRV